MKETTNCYSKEHMWNTSHYWLKFMCNIYCGIFILSFQLAYLFKWIDIIAVCQLTTDQMLKSMLSPPLCNRISRCMTQSEQTSPMDIRDDLTVQRRTQWDYRAVCKQSDI